MLSQINIFVLKKLSDFFSYSYCKRISQNLENLSISITWTYDFFGFFLQSLHTTNSNEYLCHTTFGQWMQISSDCSLDFNNQKQEWIKNIYIYQSRFKFWIQNLKYIYFLIIYNGDCPKISHYFA